MSHEPMVLLTPIPQIWLPQDSPRYLFGQLLAIGPITTELRRALLDISKEWNCSGDTLHLLLEADAIAVVAVPSGEDQLPSGLLTGAIFRPVADGIMRRFLDCARLYASVPSSFRQYIWFACPGTLESLDLGTLRPLNPPQDLLPDEVLFEALTPEKLNSHLHSECLAEITADEFRSVAGNAGALARLVGGRIVRRLFGEMGRHWQKLSQVCQLDLLINTYSDPKKRNAYTKAGNLHTEKRAKEHVRLLHEDAGLPPGGGPVSIPEELSTRWFFEGFCQAWWQDIELLDEGLYEERSKSQPRFARAFQIFADSFALQNPHRFVALITCLEALLTTSNSELGYQLASRVSWLLYGEDGNHRVETFDDVKRLYGLRSKIVHGGPYDLEKLPDSTDDLLDIVRGVLLRVLTDPKLESPFFCAGKAASDGFKEYLKQLSLGVVTPGGPLASQEESEKRSSV
ncbi:MAG: hypothetical protein ABIF82_02145 [Planctomycetota bacterium]